VAVLFTKTYGRVLAPGLSALDPCLPQDVVGRSALTKAWRTFEQILDDYIQGQLIAAEIWPLPGFERVTTMCCGRPFFSC
jgi:hypothetical protein